MKKNDRLKIANDLIKVISDHGRRFFYSEKFERVARFDFNSSGHLVFIDDYTGKPIYVSYSGRWRNFSHGGTLKNLVEMMAAYIKKGLKIDSFYLGPQRFGQGNIWGYAEEEIIKVRELSCDLDIIAIKSHGHGHD